MDRVKSAGQMATRQFKVILLAIGLAGAIFFIYLGWWFAAAASATF